MDNPADPEVPEADALDQGREVMSGERHGSVSRGIDVPEADSIDQAIEVPIDDEEATPMNDDEVRPIEEVPPT